MSATELPNANTRRLRAIHRRLEKRFGELVPPRAADPLDELVLTVLSQHTSDLNAERAFASLRTAYPSWEEVVAARSGDVADAIRSGGLANTKAPRIQAILREVAEREGSFTLDRLRGMPDSEARDYVMALGYLQAPVVVAGNEHWSGFRPDRINALAGAVLSA